LFIEKLEQRALLAGDLGFSDLGPAAAEGEDAPALVSIRLEAADPTSLQALDSVHQGSEFVLLAYIEDLRPDPAGVFAAYLDITYPTAFFDLGVTATGLPILFTDEFSNGRAGSVATPGLADEVGGFSSSFTPTGAGERPLVGIPLVATQTGDVQLSSNPADATPTHDILLYNAQSGVPLEQVEYGGLALEVLPPQPDKPVDAVSDSFDVFQNSDGNLLNVLVNDKNTTGESLTIAEIDDSETQGEVSASANNSVVVYTPADGFVGDDRFSYTTTADGQSDTTSVIVRVNRVASEEKLAAYDLEVTDPSGNPVDAVIAGDDFVLHVSAEDLRDDPAGVFAAYLDIQYSTSSAEVAGPIEFSESYRNGLRGDVSTDGLINESGAFSMFEPTGAGRFPVFSVPFHATSPGRVIFASDPADSSPNTDTLLYGEDVAVSPADIRYGNAVIDVLPSVIAVDDSYHLEEVGVSAVLSVLDNDVNRVEGSLLILSIDDSQLLGEVQIIEGGSAISYLPPVGFDGSEQFTYLTHAPGGEDTATVTVHIQPAASLDDLIDIRLETVDLDGAPISTVVAGDEFVIQAYIQDLRGEDVNGGVYAAYFDLLYEHSGVRPSQRESSALAVEFGDDYQNGISLNGAVPGLLDEIGAFQTGTEPLGIAPQLLFSATFQAARSQGQEDLLAVEEDSESSLDVLSNDQPNQGTTTFRADPADVFPHSETLFYEPPGAVGFTGIGFGETTIEILSVDDASIVSVATPSQGGEVQIANGGTTLLYAPAANFFGLETFSYSLDGETEVPVRVLVSPVNDSPVAHNDAYRVRQNQAIQLAASGGVLANDEDVDGDHLDAALVSGPEHGDVQFQADGSFLYTPDADYLGFDSFTYEAIDPLLESGVATVEIEVTPKPVSIRLQSVDSSGAAITEVATGQPVMIQALVQDLRGSDQPKQGIGAAYFDIGFNPETASPVPSSTGPFGIDIGFGPSYQNGIHGSLQPGRINDVGAFQSEFVPLGGEELELFTVAFDLGGPHAANDEYFVAQNGATRLDVLENESSLRWNVTLDAGPANNSPAFDVVYLNPTEAVAAEDIHYGNAEFEVRNGNLTVLAVSETSNGGVAEIDADGYVNYSPPEDYLGPDSFTYTMIDAQGRTATATAVLEVVQSWQNPVDPCDVDGDGIHSSLDALLIINELNENGTHELLGHASDFFDASGDRFVSPVDALLVINCLVNGVAASEGEAVRSVVTTAAVSGDSPLPIYFSEKAAHEDMAADRTELDAAVIADVRTTQHVPHDSHAQKAPVTSHPPKTVQLDALEESLNAISEELSRLWARE
jgi:hypothetical protein